MIRRCGPAIACAALSFGGSACSPTPIADGPRRQTLKDLTAEVVEPTLARLTEKTDALETAAGELAGSPDAGSLEAARTAWREARSPWKRSLAFGFGPAVELRSEAAIDQPVDAVRIEEVLAATDPIDASYVRQLGANKRGLHGLEYVLFLDPPETTAEAALAADDEAGARRRAYVAAVAAEVAEAARALEAGWLPSDGDFARKFAEPGSDDAAFSTVNDALDALVNESVVVTDTVASARLAKPLGLRTGSAPDPSLEESPWADASIDDMQEALVGVRNAYFGSMDGTPGGGLGRLVQESSPRADRGIREAFDRAFSAVERLPRPYDEALTAKTGDVEVAYEAVRDLKRALATEIVSLLGATLKFNDNDGD